MYGDDSDEDLYDKTKKKAKKVAKAETHDELVVKQKEVEANMKKMEELIVERKKTADAEKNAKEEEDLDAYMSNLSKKPLQNQKSLFVLEKELKQLKKVQKKRLLLFDDFTDIFFFYDKDNERLVKLVKLTKPSHIL